MQQALSATVRILTNRYRSHLFKPSLHENIFIVTTVVTQIHSSFPTHLHTHARERHVIWPEPVLPSGKLEAWNAKETMPTPRADTQRSGGYRTAWGSLPAEEKERNADI